MSCFDSTFPKFSPPLSFSQKTKLSVSYFDVKVVWDNNIPGNAWNKFFIRYESLHVRSSRRFTYLITPSQLYSTNASPWSRLRWLRGTSVPPPPPLVCRTSVPSEIRTPRNADLQARLNELIRNNQVDAVRNGNRKHETGTKSRWNTVNKIIGREFKALKHQLCYQPWGHKPFLSNQIVQ